MTTQPQPERTDLAAWLLAQIAEDERVAREAIEPAQMHPWGDTTLPQVAVSDVPDEVRGYLGGTWGEHFARHDPARVLADCAAKRKIVEAHSRAGGAEDATYPESANDCKSCGWGDNWEVVEYGVVYPCLTLRLLAVPYADRPGYNPAWGIE